MLEKDEKIKSVKGTNYFSAPECCEEGSNSFEGKPLDIWALGVTMFILIFKKLPFYLENEENVIGLLNLIAEAK